MAELDVIVCEKKLDLEVGIQKVVLPGQTIIWRVVLCAVRGRGEAGISMDQE